MEPEDMATFANEQSNIDIENLTAICTSLVGIHGRGSFLQSNPLSFTLPLLLIQLSLASAAILLVSLFLKPLHQSSFVAQSLGGILLGPSVLGLSNAFTLSFFPLRGFMLLDILSLIGYMFYLFLVGVEMDPLILKKINKKMFVIGILAVVVPLILTQACSLFLLLSINMEPKIARTLPIVAQAESVLAFPTVTSLLTELNIIDSEIGRVASCTSTVSGLFSFSVTTSMVFAGQSLRDKKLMTSNIIGGIVFTFLIVFIIRPAVLRIIRKNTVGGLMKQSRFVALLVMVLLTGFCSQAAGLHVYYGPFILGITIPADSPVGFALKEELSFITYWVLMPVFFLKNGLVIDVFSIKLRNYMVLQSVCVVAAVGKFLGAFVSSLYYKMPMVDAISLGLVMSTQGLLELGLFKMMKKDTVVDNEAFVIMCISMLIIMGCITPLVKRLYDPSRRYLVYKKRTVSNARPNSELRLLLCLHEEDNAPTAINLLEALNPTIESPLSICVLHLVELVGLKKHLLIPHKAGEKPYSSEAIFKAFRYYEQSNLDLVSISVYTGISPCATMHDDVCALANDQRTSLVVIPFHKKFHADGTRERESCHKAALIMNKNFLDKVPCSVAILVDRGLLKSSRPILELGSWSPYRVGVVFLGGRDDREALAIGARMAGHANIKLTMIRLLVNGNVRGSDADESRLDNESLSGFRQALASNCRITYIEEVVMDGSGTLSVIQSMEKNYELVLVGRNHDRQLPPLSGLEDFGEHAELGGIGQILASADFMGNATVLVVQQHNKVLVLNGENKSKKYSLEATNSTEDYDDEVPIQRRS